MKKYLIALALAIFTFGMSQSNDYYDDYYYGDTYDYPEDYYSEYPEDYYPEEYYRDNYNDYRHSVTGINWDNLFAELNLNPVQINSIIVLNNRFPSYQVWNQYYRVNVTRWYYDRFYALRHILTPYQYVTFQNRLYGGVPPVVYFVNNYQRYYVPRFRVRPHYRSVNINIYRRSPWQIRHDHGRRYVVVPHRSQPYRNYDNQQNRRWNSSNRGYERNRSGRRDQDYYEQNNRPSQRTRQNNSNIRGSRLRDNTTRQRSNTRNNDVNSNARSVNNNRSTTGGLASGRR